MLTGPGLTVPWSTGKQADWVHQGNAERAKLSPLFVTALLPVMGVAGASGADRPPSPHRPKSAKSFVYLLF